MRDQPADDENRDGGQDDGQVGDDAFERVSEHADQLRSPCLQSVHACSEGPDLTVGAILLDSRAARETHFSEIAPAFLYRGIHAASMPASNTSSRRRTSVILR